MSGTSTHPAGKGVLVRVAVGVAVGNGVKLGVAVGTGVAVDVGSGVSVSVGSGVSDGGIISTVGSIDSPASPAQALAARDSAGSKSKRRTGILLKLMAQVCVRA